MDDKIQQDGSKRMWHSFCRAARPTVRDDLPEVGTVFDFKKNHNFPRMWHDVCIDFRVGMVFDLLPDVPMLARFMIWHGS